jgi:hypothetical protein
LNNNPAIVLAGPHDDNDRPRQARRDHAEAQASRHDLSASKQQWPSVQRWSHVD